MKGGNEIRRCFRGEGGIPDAVAPDFVPTLNLRGRLLRLERPLVMGILNATPDSFYGGSRVMDAKMAVERAGAMLSSGADILDIGACSTRPGSQSASEQEELERLECVVPAIRESFPEAVISIDTFRSRVASECMERWDVDIINDVSGGADPEMMSAVASFGKAYVVMHSRGDAATMDALCRYGRGVVAEVLSDLAFKVQQARLAGICDVIADPGFGFAKTDGQNFELLGELEVFRELGCPILAGVSRKRITRPGGEPEGSEEALWATIALNTVAMMKGASILRVHDVKAAAVAVKMIERLW